LGFEPSVNGEITRVFSFLKQVFTFTSRLNDQ